MGVSESGRIARMSALEYLLLAIASSFWPLLYTVVLIVLRTTRPLVLLSSFLAGALLACISIGLLLVFLLDDTSLVSEDRHGFGAAVDIVAGALALVAAALVLHRRRTRAQPRARPRRWAPERLVANAKVAFVAGIVLDLLPGVLPFVALANIAEGGYSAGANVVLVVVFYLIMFTPVELPILGYVIVPDRTVATVERLNDWMDRNATRIGADVLALVGVYLIARGLLQL